MWILLQSLRLWLPAGCTCFKQDLSIALNNRRQRQVWLGPSAPALAVRACDELLQL